MPLTGYADDYQKQALDTKFDLPLEYFVGKLSTEANELGDIVWKNMRDNGGTVKLDGLEELDIALELGDIMWYVAVIADILELPLSLVMDYNLKKLANRKTKGTLKRR